MSVCGVVWYRCTQVPRPCPCHQTKPSSPPLLSSCHHLPPPQRNLEAAISSASSGLIHFSLRASSSPPSVSVVIPMCASPLYPLQPGPSHPHRHHLAARKPSEQPPLLAISQPAQPAHSPTSLSQPFASTNSHQLPPRTSPTPATESGQDASPPTQSILPNKGTPPSSIIHHHAHELSRTPPTSHCHTMVHGTMLLGAGPRGVSRHTNVCASLLAHSARAAVSSKLVQGLTPYEAHLEPGP